MAFYLSGTSRVYTTTSLTVYQLWLAADRMVSASTPVLTVPVEKLTNKLHIRVDPTSTVA